MRSTNHFILALLGVLLLIGGIGMAFVIPRLILDFGAVLASPNAPWTLALFSAIVVYLAFVVVLFVDSIRHGGRGPIRVEVGPTGFALVWADGCKRLWNWDHLRDSIRLTDLRGANVACEAEIQLSMAGSGSLSGEACDAIVASARVRGLSVRTREFAGSAYIARNTSILIRRDSTQFMLLRQYAPKLR
jgi:hypothetical protein